MKILRPISDQLIRNLMEEHVVILQALNVLRIITDRVEKRRPVAVQDLKFLSRFLTDYADKIHHHAEEELLFDSLAEVAPRPLRRMIERLMTQHVLGRFFAAQISEAVSGAVTGARGWRKRFVSSARIYEALLSCHICGEEDNVFPAIDRLIDKRGIRVQAESQLILKRKVRMEKALRRIASQYSNVSQNPGSAHQCERNSAR